MRVAKSLKMVCRTAVGGGLMLFLSGGAFAAEGGAGTTSQTTDGSISQTNQTSSIDGNTTGSVSLAVTNNSDQRGDQNGSSGGGSVVNGTDNQITGQPQTLSAPGAPSLTSADISVPTTLQPSGAGSTAEPILNPTDKGAGATSVVNADTTIRTDGLTPVAAMGQMVDYHSTWLTIQPRITSSNVRANDLASLVPSAPAQQQNPSNPPIPNAPNGLFGDLTSKLALTVVPSVFAFADLSLLGLGVAISILVAGLYIALGYAVMAIGSWTRRGGYAHAARSDVPAEGTFTTFFATPLRLGYVSAFAPVHSPFLMVSDTKTVLSTVPNAFRKEEMK